MKIRKLLKHVLSEKTKNFDPILGAGTEGFQRSGAGADQNKVRRRYTGLEDPLGGGRGGGSDRIGINSPDKKCHEKTWIFLLNIKIMDPVQDSRQ